MTGYCYKDPVNYNTDAGAERTRWIESQSVTVTVPLPTYRCLAD